MSQRSTLSCFRTAKVHFTFAGRAYSASSGCQLLLRVAPVNSFQQMAHLGRRQSYRATHGGRPDEAAPFQPLGIERQSDSVMPEALGQCAAASPEHEHVASEEIATEPFLHEQRARPRIPLRMWCAQLRSTSSPPCRWGSSQRQQHRHHQCGGRSRLYVHPRAAGKLYPDRRDTSGAQVAEQRPFRSPSPA